jgi:DNA end-binding protein Ku
MAQRAIWRGHLRLALVSCPVALYTAKHDGGNIHFHLINPDTGNRVRMITQDAETDQTVSRKDLVKGYEFKKDTYVLLTDEDFANVKVESSSTMVIEKFVEAGSIDPLYYDSSYFLAPDGKAGVDVYAVLYEAIEKTGRVALSRVVIAQRERTVALRPMKGGLAAHTLHEQRDINEFGRNPPHRDQLEDVKIRVEQMATSRSRSEKFYHRSAPGPRFHGASLVTSRRRQLPRRAEWIG